MKIFLAQQIKRWDSYTIQNKPISSFNLMKKASLKCTDWLKEKYNKKIKFYIFCGHGNNGGDGLCIAKNLYLMGYKVEIYAVKHLKYALDFNASLDACYNSGMEVCFVRDKTDLSQKLENNAIIIDALLGSGLSKPLHGIYKDLVEYINATKNKIISIDIPSGVFCDKSLDTHTSTFIIADFTLSFELPKLSFLLPDIAFAVGEWHLLSIGLDRDFMEKETTPYHYITREDVQSLLKPRNKFSHKGNYGHVLLVSGSKGKMGAAILSGLSCLRSGVGLLTIHVPKCGYHIMQSVVPEAMVQEDAEEDYITKIHFTNKHVVAIGPGIGQSPKTAEALLHLIKHHDKPVVLDADAINIISKNKKILKHLPPKSIFTPHPKEFSRLLGKWKDDNHKLELLKSFSETYDCYVILKGAYTILATPERYMYFNSTGNPGMATGGSGDALLGIIASLMAQGYDSNSACIIGVFLHGKSADLIIRNESQESLIARDIVAGLGQAYRYIKGESLFYETDREKNSL